MTSFPHTSRDERGVTLVMVALVMSGLLGVAALAVDGGRLFSARRQSQNASDAAAIAGASALFAYQDAAARNAQTPGSVTQPSTQSIYNATTNLLSQNTTSLPVCNLTDASGNALEACNGASDAQLQAASGVQAGASVSQPAAFSQVLGINTYKASATATASIQPVVGAGSPFILCGASSGGYGILDNNDQIISNAASQNPFTLQGSQVPDCNAPNSKFKGLGSTTATPTVGSWEGITNGNRFSASVSGAVAGQTACPTDPTTLQTFLDGGGSCGMLIPIASKSNGDPSNPEMYIVNFAIFVVTKGPNGTAKYVGNYVAPDALVSQGQGAFAVHCESSNQVCTVNLIT